MTKISILIGLAILLLCLVLLLIYLITGGGISSVSIIQQVRERVHIGDRRQDVHVALSDAWSFTTCEGHDLFFYGAKTKEKSIVIYVGYDQEKVTGVIGIVDNYTLPVVGDKCNPSLEEIFKDKISYHD